MRKFGTKWSVSILAALPLLVAAASSSADNKPIRIIVPFAAGGPADVVARQVADNWSARLGQPMIVENQGGAMGAVALSMITHAAPDGQTILFAASGNITSQPVLNGTEAEVAKLSPISMVSTGPHVLVVTSKLPVKNTQELVAYAKANPGKLNFGSAGVGGLAHLGTELFKSATGTDVVHVPYRGTSQVTKDLISGDVQAMFSSLPSLKPLIDAGKIRAIGLTALSSSADAKGIPTIGASVPGFEYISWYAVFAPPGTPKPVIERLRSTLSESLANKALRDKLDSQGVEIASSTPEQLREVMQQETAKWKRIIQEAHITAK